MYNVSNSFANHLRSICLTGDISTNLVHDFVLSEQDFARHDAILNFIEAPKFKDVDVLSKKDNSFEKLTQGMSKELAKKLMKIIRFK